MVLYHNWRNTKVGWSELTYFNCSLVIILVLKMNNVIAIRKNENYMWIFTALIIFNDLLGAQIYSLYDYKSIVL